MLRIVITLKQHKQEGCGALWFELSWTRKGMQDALPAGSARPLFVVRDDDAAATIEGEFQVAVSVAPAIGGGGYQQR
jgi:hypothetical protein